MNRRDLGLILGGVVAGISAGIPLGAVLFDKRVRKEYDTSLDAMRRGYESALNNVDVEPPVETEEKLVEILEVIEESVEGVAQQMGEVFEKTTEKYNPAPTNPYHVPVEASSNPNAFRVPEGMEHFEYIDPEDFEDDDDRVKHKVTMLKAEVGLPMIFLDGAQIDEWDQHVGENIVVDYYRLQPTGQGSIFVRNHKRDEDYEVFMEMP